MPDIDPDVAQSVLDEARRAYAAAGTALRRANEVAEAAGIPVEDDTITTQRINIVEPDGTPRLILTGAARLPGAIVRGEEFPHPGRSDLAGMIFYNDEGTETGGLIYAGRQGSADVHLSFDNFEQDQVIVLESHDDGPAERTAMLEFWDRPDWSLYDVAAAEREGDADAFDRTVAEHGGAPAGCDSPVSRIRLLGSRCPTHRAGRESSSALPTTTPPSACSTGTADP